MLERAARCIETAGQHILLGSKAPLRSRRVLHSRFWHHGAADIDIPLWCFGFLWPASLSGESDRSQRPQSTTSTSPSSSARLDFLYPPQTRSFARTYLRTRGLHKGSGVRRRKKSAARGFASSAPAVDHDGAHSTDGAANSIETLRELLSSKDRRDYSAAWDLFRDSGAPKELISQVLTYLSTSDKAFDASRTRMLFEEIPDFQRKDTDFLCAAKASLVLGLKDFRLRDIYDEAASRGEAGLCWGFAMSFLVNRKKWHDALEYWNIRPVSFSNRSDNLPGLSLLPFRVLALLEAVHAGEISQELSGLVDLVKFLVRQIISNPKMMIEMPSRSLLSLFGKLDSLKLLETRIYLKAISTLHSTGVRPAIARSVLLYRSLRWRLPNERVPKSLLMRLIKSSSTLELSESVDYFLEEFRHFYQKPPPEAYRFGLTTYARLGKEQEVKRLFQNYIDDHGRPSDPKVLSPLLYVYARLGQVQKTQEQFDRLLTEFNVPPNIVCWNILLTAYARTSDIEGASATFKSMVENGNHPDTYSFGILMGLLANKGDVDAVIGLFGLAKQNDVPISCAMIDGVVEALCNNRRYADAEKVVQEALQLKISGSPTRMWNILLWNYAFVADVDSVSRIQARMQQEGIDFDSMTYAALMLSLVRIGKLESARKILGTLHRSRRTHLTEFHYAILLHGYLKERNRDMIFVLYKEMIHRFGTIGLSPSLSMLRTYLSRDLQRFNEKGGINGGEQFELERAERFLEIVMKTFNVSMLATKSPQPGAERRKVTEAFPSAYYEPLLLAYGLQGETGKVDSLLEKYNTKLEAIKNTEKQPSLQLLHAQMIKFLKQGNHDEVDTHWRIAVDCTTRAAQPMDTKFLLPVKFDSKTRQSQNPHALPLDDQKAPILPSYRFALSRCMSVLMQSLSYRSLHSKIAEVIAEVEKLGFALTTFNWSLYIKLLCSSGKPIDQLRAFTLFEEKFVANFIGWGYLRRGFTKRPENAHPGLDFLERRAHPLHQYHVLGKAGRHTWAKVEPESMQPTYLTMLYLASALIDFRSRSIASGNDEIDLLVSIAPETVGAVAKLPFLREKFQGLILRGRRDMDSELGAKPIETEKHVIWTGGVLGVDGEARIDTSPVARDQEEEEGLPRRRRRYLTDPGEDESEPGADVLETMIAEDAEWGAAHFGAGSEVDLAQQTLQAQDELDFESENYLGEEQAEEQAEEQEERHEN